MDYLATALTLLGIFGVSSKTAPARAWGFRLGFSGNLAWIAWALPAGLWSVVVVNTVIAVLNVRGAWNNVR